MSLKNFYEWIELKVKLNFSDQKPPNVYPGELWWASLGKNVGFEINGKSELFTRPVIVLKRFAPGFYFVIPVTTQNRRGTWYVSFVQGSKTMVACLQQARSLDYRRLYSRLGSLDDADFHRVKDGFWNLYR
jgi:mRNA interferase MazF